MRTARYFWDVPDCELEAYKTMINDIDANLGIVANEAAGSVTLVEVKADTDIASAISLKHSNSLDHTQNTDVYLTTPVSNYLYVDMGRTDIYTPNGSITKPFLTISSALAAITPAYHNFYTLHVSSGEYLEQITLKPFVSIIGSGSNATRIIMTDNLDAVIAPTSMNLGEGDLSDLSILYQGTDDTKVALRVQSRGCIGLQSVSIFSYFTAIEVASDGILIATNSSGAMGGEADLVVIKADGYALFSNNFYFSGYGTPYYDLKVESGGFCEVDGTSIFYNDLISGTVTFISKDSSQSNTSTVAGITVKDALNTLNTTHSTTLIAGTITIINTAILSSNILMYCRSTAAGVLGNLSYIINNGASIVFTSDNVADVSSINYIIY